MSSSILQAEPFNKKEFRQAFAEALDRDQIIKTVFFGVGQVAYGPFPPPSWAFDRHFKPYSGERGEGEGISEGGRQAGRLHLRDEDHRRDSPTTTQLAQLIKDQVAKAGITMNLVQLDFPTLVADTQAGKYQASLAGWSGRIDPDGNIYNSVHTGSPEQLSYSNPQVDDLIDKARAASDQAQRKDLYQQAQKIAVDDAPLVYYQFPLSFMLSRPNVQGMVVYPDQIMRFEAGWLK